MVLGGRASLPSSTHHCSGPALTPPSGLGRGKGLFWILVLRNERGFNWVKTGEAIRLGQGNSMWEGMERPKLGMKVKNHTN